MNFGNSETAKGFFSWEKEMSSRGKTILSVNQASLGGVKTAFLEGKDTLPKGRSLAVRFKLRGNEGWLFLLGVLVLWHLITTYVPFHDRGLYPTIPVVLKALWASLPELLKGTWSSALILVPGYLLAVMAGVVWGLLVGTVGWLQRAFIPFARAASPVPSTVYIPYAIAIFPTFKLSAIFVVFIGAFWPIFLNAAAGASAVPQRHRENAKVLGFSRWQYLRLVVFPSSLPHIFAGMGVGLVLSFILLTVAELFGAHAGLGRFIQFYADYADYAKMVAGILYVGLVTYLSMEALDQVKKRALFWMK